MKAKFSVRSLLIALVAGGALLATSLPALADSRGQTRYEAQRHDHRYDHRRHGHSYDRRYDHRNHRSGYRHSYPARPPVVYRYYHPRVIHYPPPRVVYRYDPGVVVHVPPIVFHIR